jgi:hypothetical protein
LADRQPTYEVYDVYALAHERSKEVVGRFRDRWLTGLTEAAEDYPVPQLSDPPDVVYDSVWELIDRMLAAPEEPYAVYWTGNRPPGQDLVAAMLFFTSESGLIAGLTIRTCDPDHAGAALRELAGTVGATFGYVGGEEPPPDSTSEFRARSRAMEINLLPR